MSEAVAGPLPVHRAWLLAARPRTLPVAAAPVVVGSAVAFAAGEARALPALAALLGSLLLQIASNLVNDWADFERGADTEARIGPPRAAQLGLLSAAQLRAGTAVVLAAATLVGLYLVWLGGWPIALLGLAAMGAAIAYTGGPWPFGYKGLGDPAVFLFFGVAAVTGTHYVQAGAFSPVALAASLPVGALATAILVVNNTRDVDTDAVAGKRTLAVRLGRRGARVEYALLVLGAYLAPPLFWWAGAASPWGLATFATLPIAVSLVRTVATETDGPSLNGALAGTARLSLLWCLLFALGLAT